MIPPKVKYRSSDGKPLFSNKPQQHDDRVLAFRIFYNDIVAKNKKLAPRHGRHTILRKIVRARPQSAISEDSLVDALWALYATDHFRSDTKSFETYPPCAKARSAGSSSFSTLRPDPVAAQQPPKATLTSASVNTSPAKPAGSAQDSRSVVFAKAYSAVVIAPTVVVLDSGVQLAPLLRLPCQSKDKVCVEV